MRAAVVAIELAHTISGDVGDGDGLGEGDLNGSKTRCKMTEQTNLQEIK
jgi:hypothetical protein